MSDKGVKINTTEKIKGGTTPGLGETLTLMDEYDMNQMKDPDGKGK